MEPPRGFLASLWNFICFLPYFIGLLLLGAIKGVVLCPFTCLIVTIGNSTITLGLWPMHFIWTCYSIVGSKKLGPVLKLVLCICIPIPMILWPVIATLGSVVGGAAYGFLSPIFATFDAVGEGKTNVFFHCFYDGTWSTVKVSVTIVRDFGDFCYHSYLSFMYDLRQRQPTEKFYEIRLLYLPCAVVVGVVGFMFDFPVISLLALSKSPYMLFKGWHRLFRDLIGREGLFLETICVPFAGLAIILWPLAVVGAVLGSMVASIFLGAYAGVVVYQESSPWFGLCYIVASLSIYDEYSNDVLDMPEGSCFPRPKYRQKTAELSKSPSRSDSLSKTASVKKIPSRAASFNNPMIELKPLEFLDSLFEECQHHGERMVAEGVITPQDIEDAKKGQGSSTIRIGLPSYCLLQLLLRSAKANSDGILLRDDRELTSSNRPKDIFFDWFFIPLSIIKDQIKAENISVAEEDYLCKLVLFSDNPVRFRNSFIGVPPESERRRAEFDALARRLRGITKSISRQPTCRRRFDALVKLISNELAKKNVGGTTSNGEKFARSKSALARIFSQKSFKNYSSNHGPNQDPEAPEAIVRNIDIV